MAFLKFLSLFIVVCFAAQIFAQYDQFSAGFNQNPLAQIFQNQAFPNQMGYGMYRGLDDYDTAAYDYDVADIDSYETAGGKQGYSAPQFNMETSKQTQQPLAPMQETMPEQTVAPIYTKPVVMTQYIDQNIIQPKVIKQPIIQQRLVEQPIIRTRIINQPVIRRIVTQPVIRPHVIQKTTVVPLYQEQQIVQPKIIEQNIVRQQLVNKQVQNQPIVQSPTVATKKGGQSYGGQFGGYQGASGGYQQGGEAEDMYAQAYGYGIDQSW